MNTYICERNNDKYRIWAMTAMGGIYIGNITFRFVENPKDDFGVYKNRIRWRQVYEPLTVNSSSPAGEFDTMEDAIRALVGMHNQVFERARNYENARVVNA